MERRNILVVVLVLVSGILFMVSNHYLRGYLRSELTLAKEIKTPLDSIDQYKISEEAPFKYRLLFPTIVSTTYDLLYDGTDVQGFYGVYKFWSVVFYATAALSFFWLLLTCGFSDLMSFVGSCLFLLMPPMLMAYTLPVHTREDTLAYTLFFCGLVFLLRNKGWAFVITSLLAVLCRETLLLLPFLYFFYGPTGNWSRRFVFAALPVICWISLRIAFGHEDYDVWLGLRWNLNNPEQVAGFLFITFNFCWLPFLSSMWLDRNQVTGKHVGIRFFFKSAWVVLALILITTFVGGIYNEIRLLYLFVPWVLILTLDFVERKKDRLTLLLSNQAYWMFGFTCFVF
jgi:hypothetical protein